MATERKLSLLIATFPYGSNGAAASTHPDAQQWADDLFHTVKDDSRIERVGRASFNDTPITMTRNDAVKAARDSGFDMLLMVDSDQKPDIPREGAVPFWKAAFDFLYNHYDKGPVVIGAPYCGPPPHENVYVFHWLNQQSAHPNCDCHLGQYTREQADVLSGIQACAALPTGTILFDVRVFELTEPKQDDCEQQVLLPWLERIRRGETTFTEADVTDLAEQVMAARLRNEQSWFYYEYEDKFQTDKCSTEDVTATRDLSMMGMLKLGYNPIHCAWDSWAGHWKPKCVGPPVILKHSDVGAKYERAATEGTERGVKQIEAHSPISDEINWSGAHRFSEEAERQCGINDCTIVPLARDGVQGDGQPLDQQAGFSDLMHGRAPEADVGERNPPIGRIDQRVQPLIDEVAEANAGIEHLPHGGGNGQEPVACGAERA